MIIVSNRRTLGTS